MPPFHSRSTGACRIACISSAGVIASTPVGAGRAPRAPAGVTGIDLAVRGKTPPPSEISAGVVVGPATSAAARTAAAARRTTSPASGSGSRKMCRWSKAATSRMCSDSSMPLPNTSPDMSPMPTHGEVLGLGVDAQLAEVPLDRLPGAAGGDAHRLVVVADRAAGGERVAEPEAVVLARPRWRCRRTSRCPCRRRPPGRGRRRRGGPRPRGGTTSPSTRLSVMSSRPEMNVW